MKIFGFAYVDGRAELLLKGDSALLPNRKPFFFPEDGSKMAAYPCIVFRVSRLGKNIAPRFACRYVDSYAAGLHIEDTCALAEARAAGRPWTTAIAADGSLPVGTFISMQEGETPSEIIFSLNGTPAPLTNMVLNIDEAIAEVSRHITIRQGDLLFITSKTMSPFMPKEEDYISANINNEENLFCKFK